MGNVIPVHIANRKGPRNLASVDPEALDYLERGWVETKNLMEYLAIDRARLLANVLAEQGLEAIASQARAYQAEWKQLKVKASVQAVLSFLNKHLPSLAPGDELFAALSYHPSDLVRGWMSHVVGSQELPLATLLEQMRPFAADPNYGVREEAWLALRHHIVAQPEHAVEILTPWVAEENPFLQRFAVEATRPRGVWCAHIPLFREQPALGLPLLVPLQAAEHKYVQDSVANWLNDAAKDHPDWVMHTTEGWLMPEASTATRRIVTRARRSIA